MADKDDGFWVETSHDGTMQFSQANDDYEIVGGVVKVTTTSRPGKTVVKIWPLHEVRMIADNRDKSPRISIVG
jgi:hypothetical protein